MAQFLFKRSGTADKRPDPAQMALGEVDLNYDTVSGGLFYKDSGGGVIKVGPAQVSATAPNATPAGSSGNALGEFWYDTGSSALCIWNGSAWQATGGGGILPSSFTQCGDILVGTGAGTYTALAVPRTFFPTVGVIDGCALVSCGACAEGVAWGNPFISSTALVASSAGALIVNGCDYGGATCFTSVLPGPSAPGQVLTYAYDPANPAYLSGQGFLNWCTPNFISQSSFGPGALVVGCTPGSTGGICTVGSLVNINDPGVSPGYYPGVTVTTCTGAGSGALANVNVINAGYFPVFDSVEIVQPGTGYALANQVGFEICGTTVTATGSVCSLNQTTVCKAGYLSVGTNGQVLTADSACALGVKWAASGGVPSATPTVAGVVFGCTASSIIALGCNSQAALTTGDNNVSVGFNSLCTNSTGSRNTAVGSNTLCSQTGNNGTAVGFSALLANTGDNNTAVGLCAAICNSSGSSITAVGANTLLNNTTGFANSAFGSGALTLNLAGQRNVGVGYNSLTKNTSGSFNVGLGDTALGCNTTGGCNVGVGFYTLALGTTGCFNVALGHLAGCGSTGGNCNVVIGPCAQVSNLTGSCQLAIGFACDALWLTGDSTKAIKPGAGIIDCAGSCGTAGQVLVSNGANAICWGAPAQATPTVLGTVYGRNDACENVAYGQCALACMGTSGPFVGGNVAVGCLAMGCSTTGGLNVAIGQLAMCSTSGALFNVAVGAGALAVNTNGNCNIALGNGSASKLTGSWCNIAIGASALSSVAAAVFDNVGIGTASLLRATHCGNVAVGHRAACDLTTGCCNVILGNTVQVPVATGSCQLAIGFSATDNWLTGDSTKAIKPGAGIIDCAGSCGTAGQVLMSNGSNAICWVNSILPSFFTTKGQLITSCAAGVATALNPGGDGELLAVCAACPTGFTWAAPGGVAAAQPYTAGAVYGSIYLYCEGYPPFYCSMSFGYGSMANTDGLNSNGTLAVGHDVLQQAVSTFGNTAIGISAMFFGNENQNNVAIGNAAMYGTCCATNNIAIGNGTLVGAIGAFLGDTNSCGNVAIGTQAMSTLSTGSLNIGIGDGVSTALTTGDNNIFIGAGTGNSTDGLACITTESNRILMGNCLHTCAQIQVAWSTVSDVRDKALDPAGVPYGLLFVEKLQPIAYRWCNRCTNEVTDDKLRYGFSAQNVRELEGEHPVIVSDDNPDKLMITDQHLLPVLVNAIKELSERNRLLEERIGALEDKA